MEKDSGKGHRGHRLDGLLGTSGGTAQVEGPPRWGDRPGGGTTQMEGPPCRHTWEAFRMSEVAAKFSSGRDGLEYA